MKRKRISETIDNISLKYTEEAAEYRGESVKRPSEFLRRAVVAAACFALIIAGILTANFIESKNLPVIELGIDNAGGMSFEGYFLKNADEFLCDNPWNSQLLPSKLPVYSNTAFDDKGVPCALSEKQLEERVGIAARESGTTVTDVIKSYASELYSDYEKDFVYAISAETADGSIVANAAGGLTVSFNNPVSLPFEFVNGNRDHAEKAIRYFSDRFSGLISGFVDFEEPAFAVSYKYDVYGEINGEYIAYNSADDRVGDILNYNLQYAEFILDENGSLLSVYICNSFYGAEKIGDYPVISVNKAKEELVKGNCISSVPYDFPGEEYVEGVELIYKHGRRESIAPYYRFIVELPEAPSVNGEIKNYGAYYVPAIKDKYISEIIMLS